MTEGPGIAADAVYGQPESAAARRHRIVVRPQVVTLGVRGRSGSITECLSLVCEPGPRNRDPS